MDIWDGLIAIGLAVVTWFFRGWYDERVAKRNSRRAISEKQRELLIEFLSAHSEIVKEFRRSTEKAPDHWAGVRAVKVVEWIQHNYSHFVGKKEILTTLERLKLQGEIVSLESKAKDGMKASSLAFLKESGRDLSNLETHLKDITNELTGKS